jgi:hypothetical protein
VGALTDSDTVRRTSEVVSSEQGSRRGKRKSIYEAQESKLMDVFREVVYL